MAQQPSLSTLTVARLSAQQRREARTAAKPSCLGVSMYRHAAADGCTCQQSLFADITGSASAKHLAVKVQKLGKPTATHLQW